MAQTTYQQTFVPNNVQTECICVPKIFDWVIAPIHTQKTVSIPRSCLQIIKNIPNLTVEYMSQPNGFQLLKPNQTQILSLKRSVHGLSDQMAVATFSFSVPVTLSLLNKDLPQSRPVCIIMKTIQVILRDVVICLPAPLNKQNITCGVISSEGIGMVLGNEVQLYLDLCVNVQVQAETKLEIPSKICQPRQFIPAPGAAGAPQVCPICPIPVKDEFCGNFRIDCNQNRHTLWESVGISPFPSGTITITLEEGCSSIDVIINEIVMFEVKKGQSQSLTFEFIEKVEIQCHDEESLCLGKYCMSIHYFAPAKNDSTN
jgi:hypothetical protein